MDGPRHHRPERPAMRDVIELILGALAVVLCGAAFAVGGQVIREARRGASKPPSAGPAPGTTTDRDEARR